MKAALLWLYGRGKLGALALDYFAATGKKVSGTFEQDEEAPRDARIGVAIVTAPYRQIEKRLRARGFTDIWPIYDLMDSPNHPLRNGWRVGPFSRADKERIKKVRLRWEDDISRAHYLQFIAWRRWRREISFCWAPLVPVAERYFIPEIRAVLHGHEIFMDCGAYLGEASLKAREVIGRYVEIIAIEPMYSNLLQLVRNVKDAKIISAALWQQSGRGRMFGDGMTARLDPLGTRPIRMTSIDELEEAPTFIKIHLEGGELDALRGAEKTLKRFRPIVVAGVYHNSDGICRTPEYLMELLENYRFLFRLYCWCGCGAVIYAIPKERQ